MTRRARWVVGAVLTGVLVAGTLVALTPWIERQLIRTLEAQGLEAVSLRVVGLGLRGVVLENVTAGIDAPFSLKQVHVRYSLRQLQQQRLGMVTLDGLRVVAYRGADGFTLRGMESLLQTGDAAQSLPVSETAFARYALDGVQVKNGVLEVAERDVQVHLPLDMTLQLAPHASLVYTAPNARLGLDAYHLETGALKLEAALAPEVKRWDGTWSIQHIALSGAPMALPPLIASGTVRMEAEELQVDGTVRSATNDIRGTFRFVYAPKTATPKLLHISNVRVPWSEGMIGVDAARISLGSNKPTQLTLVAERLSVAALLRMFAGERATGTGLVSGKIPLTIDRRGALQWRPGTLAALAPGQLSLAPEVIPGNQPQVELVRNVLKNLHYTTLTMAVEKAPDGKMRVRLVVEGKNPDLPSSRAVRLNVQLQGDVLNLIRQNVIAVQNPQQFLEKRSQ